MINKILLSIALTFVVLIANGQMKISPYTQSFLLNHSTQKSVNDFNGNKNNMYVKSVTIGATSFVDAFITLNEGASTSAVVAEGVNVYARVGDILTVQIPVDKIVQISNLEDVKQISVAQPVKLRNDKSRVSTNVSTIHAGTGLKQAYTGKGVVVGVVDTGIDVNHIAFTDEDGASRVKRVYFPSDNSGTAPSGSGTNGSRFSGSEYTTTEAIAKLTTDEMDQSHGTHTTSIAAGGYKGNAFYGMAPEADIVMVGTPELSDVNIANGIIYTFNYANKVNKPAVVNLSLGGNMGPHDGSTTINKICDKISKKGNVIIISAGNEGSDKLYLNKTFSSATDELKTFLINYKVSLKYKEVTGYVDAWSRTKDSFGIKLVVYNINTNKIMYESKVFNPGATMGEYIITNSNDNEFAKYYTGQVSFVGRINGDNNRYNVFSTIEVNSKNSSVYRLGLVYSSDTKNTIDVWADDSNLYLSGENVSGWTDGDPSYSINDMVTTNSVISVGAYAARKSFTNINGETLTQEGFNVGDIAYFSSYGIDFNGVSRPDVTAPGVVVVSAINSYDQETVSNSQELAVKVTLGNRKHHWATMSGTSMSSPAVAGIVALWLQADPTLDVAKIREILNATSIKDSYVLKGNPVQWGAGKIDANAGLVSILKSGVEGVVTDNNAVIMYPNPSDGQFTVYAQGETSNITLRVYSSNGALVASKVLDASQGEINVDLSSELTTGLYIVQIVGEKVNHTSRLIIK